MVLAERVSTWMLSDPFLLSSTDDLKHINQSVVQQRYIFLLAIIGYESHSE